MSGGATPDLRRNEPGKTTHTICGCVSVAIKQVRSAGMLCGKDGGRQGLIIVQMEQL